MINYLATLVLLLVILKITVFKLVSLKRQKKNTELYYKAVLVIDSCENFFQVASAFNYLDNLLRFVPFDEKWVTLNKLAQARCLYFLDEHLNDSKTTVEEKTA